MKSTIVLGGGCFWCMEAVFQRLAGVLSVQSGYAGGQKDHPGYQEVCTGETGHAEVILITYDSQKLSLEELLSFFWRAHDPTTFHRQGQDTGSQYRSIILYNTREEKELAQRSRDALAASGLYPHPPVTEILPLERFWPAEDGHKDYFEKNRQAGYCRVVIEPKLKKLALLDKSPSPE